MLAEVHIFVPPHVHITIVYKCTLEHIKRFNNDTKHIQYRT